ncbi:MAG: hypothetical protein M3O32_12415, partial [Actinomycetota bacterium]|nr:hypothetical protein [Actinomycetota bacterium]
PVAVNLFAPPFDDSHLPDRMVAALSAHGLASAELTLEITEDIVIEDLPRARNVLERLRNGGIRGRSTTSAAGSAGCSTFGNCPSTR